MIESAGGTYWQGPWLYQVTVSIIGIERHRIVGRRDLGRKVVRVTGRVNGRRKLVAGQQGISQFLTKKS
jgi:hypothetical protein